MDIQFKVFEVILLLRALDTKESTGPDGISALFLQQVVEEVAPLLTFLIITNHWNLG